jgi:hypothetical protein
MLLTSLPCRAERNGLQMAEKLILDGVSVFSNAQPPSQEEQTEMKPNLSRRDFLKLTGMTALGLCLSACCIEKWRNP